MGITMHLSEVREDADYARSQGFRSPAELAMAHGLLGPRTVLAHCVWTDEEDWALFQQTGTTASHNPASNAKCASGTAPVHRMLQAGVNVALGCDGGPSNNAYDMIRDLRLASYLGSLRENDPTVVPAETVLEMATVHGAKALGLDSDVGSIEPGKKADLILIDMDKPHLVPSWDPVSTVAYAAAGSDVDTVVIDGRVVMQGRKVLSMDEGAIVEEARRRAPAVAERAGLRLGPRWPVI
jgi:cytosine/adenosine deaminase-related metal-dependent hydrolase